MWDATTRKRAPHKPLLLLAVMDLVARGVITSRVISITGALVELNDLFTDYWRSIVPVTRTSSIAFTKRANYLGCTRLPRQTVAAYFRISTCAPEATMSSADCMRARVTASST